MAAPRRSWLWRCKEFENVTVADGLVYHRAVRTFYLRGKSIQSVLVELGVRSKAHQRETGNRLTYDFQEMTPRALWRSRGSHGG